MSIGQLLNVEASIATGDIESLESSPSIVSVFVAEELEGLGIRTVPQLLSLVPGLIMDTGTFGNPTPMIRGAIDNFGNKVLVMLNGVPHWSPAHGQIPLLDIPFSAIDRVEVIRGPGPVIYGSTAIAGAINFITLSSSTRRIRTMVGAHNNYNVSGYWGCDCEDWHLSISAEYQQDTGYNGFLSSDETTGPFSQPASVNYFTDVASVLMMAKSQHWQSQLHLFNSATGGRRNSDFTPATTDNEGILASIRYSDSLQDGHYEFYADIDNYFLNVELANGTTRFDHNGRDNLRIRAGTAITVDFDNNMSLLIGAESELRKTAPYRLYLTDGPVVDLVFADDNREHSVYSQLDTLIKQWRFLVGARYVKNEKAGSRILPRLSVVRTFDNQSSLKLLYSSGFTAPNFIQTSINLPNVVQGNQGLSNEVIHSVDLAYSWVGNQKLIVFNAFHYTGDNFIRRVPASLGLGDTYINDESFQRNGVEIDFQYKQTDVQWLANISYHHKGNTFSSTDAQLLLIPKWSGNLGFTKNYGEHQFGSLLHLQSRRGKVASKAYLSLNYQWRFHSGQLFVTLRNALSEAAFHPDLGTGTPVFTPSQDSNANLLTGIQITF